MECYTPSDIERMPPWHTHAITVSGRSQSHNKLLYPRSAHACRVVGMTGCGWWSEQSVVWEYHGQCQMALRNEGRERTGIAKLLWHLDSQFLAMKNGNGKRGLTLPKLAEECSYYQQPIADRPCQESGCNAQRDTWTMGTHRPFFRP